MGPILKLLGLMALLAALAGVVGYELGVNHLLIPSPFVVDNIPPDRWNQLFAAGGSHLASYAVGFLGGIVLAVWAWRKRTQLARVQSVVKSA